MKKINKALLAVFLMILMICVISTAAAERRASSIISRTTVELSGNKTAMFNILAKVDCKKIGVVSYTLYLKNGTAVKSETIDDYGTDYYMYTTTVNLSDYIEDGKTYYVTANFYADGETTTTTSGTRTF